MLHTPFLRSPVGSSRSVRVSYKILNTDSCTVSSKQGLTNQCQEGEPEHLSFASHGRYSFCPTRRGVAVSHWVGYSVTGSASRGYGGSTGRQHSNYGPQIDMAARIRAHTHRHEDAQPADHRSDCNLAQQARARLYRSKKATRYRHCEHAALTADDNQRTGPGIGDRQGEVA